MRIPALIGFALLAYSGATAVEPVESDFYTETNHLVDQTVNLVTDYSVNNTDTGDDSTALQTAIDDMTALTNGGKIIIPAGTYYLHDLEMKSNVHIEIDSGATIISNFGKTVFDFDSDNDPTPVLNASIRGIGGSFTVDISNRGLYVNKRVVGCANTNNFLVADIHVIDNWTDISCVTVNTAEYSGGVFTRSENGVIKNITGVGMAYGYGIMQMKAGKNILFKNLDGEGGATLRLESGGGIYNDPSHLVIEDVWARDIGCTNGRCAVMVSPHTRDNGYVNIDRVTSNGCGFAVTIGDGFVAGDETGTPGTFSPAPVISNVHAIYGENAQLKSKHFKYIPCDVLGLVVPSPHPKIHIGPAGANILNTANTTDSDGTQAGEYDSIITNVTQEGFLYQSQNIIDEDDAFSCNLAVTGVSVSPSTLELGNIPTDQLTANITPYLAKNLAVSWSSDNTAVATVDSDGWVTAVGPGSATITATTNDGGFTDTCAVTVNAIVDTLTPVADTFVYGNKPDNNYGGSAALDCKDSPPDDQFTRRVFLRFDLAGLDGTVITAKLRLKVSAENATDADTHTAHFVSDDSWDEDAITWNTLQPTVGTALGSAARPAVGEWIELDVTDQLKSEKSGDGKLSLALISSGAAVVSYHSSDATASADHPQLVINSVGTSGWDSFVAVNSLPGAPTAHSDDDALSDLIEFAIGGDPTDSNDQGTPPSSVRNIDDSVSFFHLQSTHLAPGITYIPEWTDDLAADPWETTWDSSTTTSTLDSDYDRVELKLNSPTSSNLFFRLRVTQP